VQPEADIRAGTATEIPVPDASTDAIIVAQVVVVFEITNPGFSLVFYAGSIERICEGVETWRMPWPHMELL
jgi:hypothetical protein